MRPLVIEPIDEGIEARLLLQRVGCGGFGRFDFQREVHALMPAVLLRMAGANALDLNPQPEPPDGQFA